MTHPYSTSLYGLRGLAGVVREGDEVVFRFRPSGVTAPEGRQIAEYLSVMVRLLGFDEPDYAGWGAGTNAGLIVVRAERDSDLDRDLQELADAMVSIAAATGRRANAVVEFLDAKKGSEVALPRAEVLEEAADRAAQTALAEEEQARAARETAREAGSRPPPTAPEEKSNALPVVAVVVVGGALALWWWRRRSS